jgi:hypothetical protein
MQAPSILSWTIAIGLATSWLPSPRPTYYKLLIFDM